MDNPALGDVRPHAPDFQALKSLQFYRMRYLRRNRGMIDIYNSAIQITCHACSGSGMKRQLDCAEKPDPDQDENRIEDETRKLYPNASRITRRDTLALRRLAI